MTASTLERLAGFMQFGPAGAQVGGRQAIDLVANAVFAVAALGLVFQVGHFAEHAFQFIVWLLGDLSTICGRDTPWMSGWAMVLVNQLGTLLFPVADAKRQMSMGMEVLHLIGNGIFLAGLLALHGFTRSRWSRWAIFIETFHLYEHLMLTLSAYFIGKPIGMSTLFGGIHLLVDRELAVGFRVGWHFAMNLLPLPFAMVAIMERWRSTAGGAAPFAGRFEAVGITR